MLFFKFWVTHQSPMIIQKNTVTYGKDAYTVRSINTNKRRHNNPECGTPLTTRLVQIQMICDFHDSLN